MSEWYDINAAPRKGEILLLLGETIPDSLDVRVGQWIHEDKAMELGDDVDSRGGWLIFNDGTDWFVVPFLDAMAWSEIPDGFIKTER